MENSMNTQQNRPTKFCKYCGSTIDMDAVLCTHCGRQVEELHQQRVEQPNIVINNANSNVNTNVNAAFAPGMYARKRSKWVALLLWFFFGFLGAHKFYEGKTGMGVLYIFTVGIFGIGLFVDFFSLIFKPNPYYV